MKSNNFFKEIINTKIRQTTNAQENDIFTISAFSKEEEDFLISQYLSPSNFKKNKWSWMEKGKNDIDPKMVRKYFIYVLLPYYIVKEDLSRADLKMLGFNPFLVKISKGHIYLSELKNKFKGFGKKDLFNLLGKDIALKRLREAQKRIDCIIREKQRHEEEFFSDLESYSNNVKKSFSQSNKEKLKWILSRMYNFNPTYFNNLRKENFTYLNIAREFLIYFIRNRFKQFHIGEILKINKRNLLNWFYNLLNMNWNQAKLEYFSKLLFISHYSAGKRAFEMIPILSKKYKETNQKFGLSKNTIRKHITEIWNDEFKKMDKNFSLLDLFLWEKYYHNIEYPRYILKYKELMKATKPRSIGYGMNYMSFEVRIIRFILVFGLSAYDGYDIHKHLIEGNKASLHHIDWIKGNDRIDNLEWLPDKNSSDISREVGYIYHHHPFVKTAEFKEVFENNILNLSLIFKEDDTKYLDNLYNFPRESYNLIKERIKNIDWINGINYYLPRGTWIKKLKIDTLDYFINKFLHPKFHNILDLINEEFNSFWEEYLEKRKLQRNTM